MEKIKEIELLKEIEKNLYPLMWYAIMHNIVENILGIQRK